MTKTERPVYTDDGKLFAKLYSDEGKEPFVVGANNRSVKVSTLIAQLCNPAMANMKRGKRQ